MHERRRMQFRAYALPVGSSVAFAAKKSYYYTASAMVVTITFSTFPLGRVGGGKSKQLYGAVTRNYGSHI